MSEKKIGKVCKQCGGPVQFRNTYINIWDEKYQEYKPIHREDNYEVFCVNPDGCPTQIMNGPKCEVWEINMPEISPEVLEITGDWEKK